MWCSPYSNPGSGDGDQVREGRWRTSTSWSIQPARFGPSVPLSFDVASTGISFFNLASLITRPPPMRTVVLTIYREPSHPRPTGGCCHQPPRYARFLSSPATLGTRVPRTSAAHASPRTRHITAAGGRHMPHITGRGSPDCRYDPARAMICARACLIGPGQEDEDGRRSALHRVGGR